MHFFDLPIEIFHIILGKVVCTLDGEQLVRLQLINSKSPGAITSWYTTFYVAVQHMKAIKQECLKHTTNIWLPAAIALSVSPL